MWSNIRICLEKPSALTFAAAPAIEILRTSDPRVDEDAKRLNQEPRFDEDGDKPRVISGRLDEWIEAHYSGDTTGIVGVVGGLRQSIEGGVTIKTELDEHINMSP